jgi:hypothetical protein
MSLNLTTVKLRARQITGVKIGRSPAETDVPDEAIEADLVTATRELNGAFAGTALKETIFTATAGVQDYSIEDNVGDDVLRISEVRRSSAYTPDLILPDQDLRLDHSGRFNAGNSSVIDPGLQGETFRVIIQQARAARAERQDGWAEAPGGLLRLMPPPIDAEVIAVEYVATGSDVTTLPDRAEQAMVYAACVALLNGAINRIGQDKVTSEVLRLGSTDNRIKTLRDQRDYYERKYENELENAKQ